MRNLISTAIVAWLVIGLFAAYQRGYFGSDREVSCKTAGDTVLTVAAGLLNYFGVNPEVDCTVPQPSD